MQHTGIGLRQPHYAALLESRPALGFVELHSENFFAPGGATRALLHEVRAHCAISLHGVGLSLGSATGLDPWHLDRLADLVNEIEPVRVSDHASFARAPLAAGQPPVHAADLLPLAFTDEALAQLCRNVQQVQERLRRPILVENLSAYLSFAEADWSEPAFLAELCRRSGCRLLLDLNNLYVNACNAGAANPVATSLAWVQALPPGCVGQIHLAGSSTPVGAGTLIVDDHAAPVPEAVWALYEQALGHLLAGAPAAIPTLIERDHELPSLAALLAEAQRAEQIQQRVLATASPPGGYAAAAPWPGAAAHAAGGANARDVAAAAGTPDAARQQALLRALWQHPPTRPDEAEGSEEAGPMAEQGPALDRGLAAYRGNARATAERALAAACPTVQGLLGDDDFAALARELWRHHPPQCGDLGEWGAALPGLLEGHADLARWPYLADCARLDWALHQCERAADITPDLASLQALAGTDPEALRLTLAPGLTVVESIWPLAAIHAAHRLPPGPAREQALQAAGHAVRRLLNEEAPADAPPTATRPQAQAQAQALLVCREGWRAVCQALPSAAETLWLRALLNRQPLGQALEQAGPGFDFAAWLPRAVQAGWLWRAERTH